MLTLIRMVNLKLLHSILSKFVIYLFIVHIWWNVIQALNQLISCFYLLHSDTILPSIAVVVWLWLLLLEVVLCLSTTLLVLDLVSLVGFLLRMYDIGLYFFQGSVSSVIGVLLRIGKPLFLIWFEKCLGPTEGESSRTPLIKNVAVFTPVAA